MMGLFGKGKSTTDQLIDILEDMSNGIYSLQQQINLINERIKELEKK